MIVTQDSAHRVPLSTAGKVNQRIHQEMLDRVRHYSAHPEQIGQRLAELDQEWDVERTLEANAATLSLAGVILSATVDRKWLFLPGIVTAFLLQHAVQGYCPPLPILRRLGFRTMREIDEERYALMALRGDFRHLADAETRERADLALEAVRR